MSIYAVNTAVAKLVVETRIEMVVKLMEFLKGKVDKDELEMEVSDINDLVNEFKETIDLDVKEVKKSKGKKSDGSDKPEKKKRVAGPYNLFLGDQIRQFKIDDPESKESKKFMSKAQDAWKALKEQYPEHVKDSAKLYELWKADNKKEGEDEKNEVEDQVEDEVEDQVEDEKKVVKNSKKEGKKAGKKAI